MPDQRYRVIERLEAGGMAEVFRAEAMSVEGFRKKVAIKRVLPHLAQNKKFISMFLDEARLGARLNHANIVSVFDIGAADDTFFIVMEFIEGSNLKTVIECMRAQNRRMQLKEAVYLCMEACRGLSYAHELTDEDGTPLHIVHRDISPPNIMLSHRGEIKLTDFGLAKAATQLEKTDPGVVKGKFSYLSPEATQGLDVDLRADIFALGIVLWELLAARRLFLGNSDYDTVKLVQASNVPSLVGDHPDVDAAFEQILLQSLAKDRDKRFQTAGEFADALAGYLFSHRMKVTSYDIANLVKEVMAKHKKSKDTTQPSIIDQLIQEELIRFRSIDEVSSSADLGAEPLSPEDVEGAAPLDMLALENPANWFADDDEVTRAISSHAEFNAPNTPGWQENAKAGNFEQNPDTGSLAKILENDNAPESHDTDPSELRSRSNLPTRLDKDDTAPQKKSKTGWIVALAILLLLGGAAGAGWYTGVLPKLLQPYLKELPSYLR